MIRLTREQVRRVDAIAMEKYRMPGVILMENAARAAAEAAWEILEKTGRFKVLVICGGGNNGGDGLAAARHLHNRGADISILLTTDPGKYSGDAQVNWQIAQAMKLPMTKAEPSGISKSKADLIIDAIFGTGLTQAPRAPFADIAGAINALHLPILAVDIPSGMDCDTGLPLGETCVRAARTVTFVAEKIGFDQPKAREFLGEVIVADIGCPRELVEEVAQLRC